MNNNFLFRDKCFLCESGVNTQIIFSYTYTNPQLFSLISERYGEFNKEDFNDVPFEIAYCSNCNFYYQTHIPSDEFYWKYLYREKNATKIPTRQNLGGTSYYRGKARDVERISVLLPIAPNKVDVLEFGSGFGHWLLLAKAYGYNVYGIEVKKERIDYSIDNGLRVFSQISELPGNQKFDFIFSEAVFEHVSEPIAYVQEIVKLLKPNGIVNISIPYGTRESINKKLIQNYKGDEKVPKIIDPLEHINVFTNKSITKLGERAGLEPIATKYVIKKFLKGITKTQNLHYLQELIKFIYAQKFGNNLYFRKKEETFD